MWARVIGTIVDRHRHCVTVLGAAGLDGVGTAQVQRVSALAGRAADHARARSRDQGDRVGVALGAAGERGPDVLVQLAAGPGDGGEAVERDVGRTGDGRVGRARRRGRTRPSRPRGGGRRWPRAAAPRPRRPRRARRASRRRRSARRRVGERRGGDQPDPQPGERPGPDAGDDGGEVAQADRGVVQAVRDGGREQFAVAAGRQRRRVRPRAPPRRPSPTVTTPAVTAGEDVSSARTNTGVSLSRAGRRAGRPVAAVRPQGRRPHLGSGARARSTSSRASASCSAMPPPHSTAVTTARGVDVQIEVVDLVERPQPVGVDVHERELAGRSGRVHPGDDEGRRHDMTLDAQPGADALHQRGLARAEGPAEISRSPRRRTRPARPRRRACRPRWRA